MTQQHPDTSILDDINLDDIVNPNRLLLGPGPSNVDENVLSAMSERNVSHLDPYYKEIMKRIQALLKYISGTGTAAMEAAVANIVEPGDSVLVAINGYFGERLKDMAVRYGGDVNVVATEWGNVFSLDELSDAIDKYQPKVVCIIHAETSTGALQPLEGVGELCHSKGALLLIDTVTSLGGSPLFLDAWGVDVAYSGTQKCVGCPSGLAPLTFSDRAMEKIRNRKTKVPSFYLDALLLENYWVNHKYHHTTPTNMNFALYTALKNIVDEGLENRWNRHIETGNYFHEKLAEIGLSCFVNKEHRLSQLTTVPDNVDAGEIVAKLRDEHNIEIAGGFGPLGGKIWRIGLMGVNANKEAVDTLITALKNVLPN